MASKDARTTASSLARGLRSEASIASYCSQRAVWNESSSSSTIASLESKWWYRLPDRIPAASAMSRTVVFLNPRSAKSCAAIASSSSRREPEPGDSGVLAADTDHLTGQVGGVVAGQEHHHVGHLPRLGGPAKRLALLELVEQLVGRDLGEERVHRQGRGDRVDTDAVRRDVEGGAPGQ